jgi:carbamoyltransferase
MPFAPIVLENDFENFFYGSASSNMAWTVKAKPAAYELIPSAIHKSGESRVQLLKRDDSLLINLLLNEYKKITGIGVLLLTSLNGKNEPIACSFDNCINVAINLKCTGILSDVGWQSFKN